MRGKENMSHRAGGISVVSLLVVFAAAPSASATETEAKYFSAAACGTARIVSGDSCSNVAVEFDLTSCNVTPARQMAKRVVCEGQKIKARFQDDENRFEAEYKKEDDGWGGVRWSSAGTVRRWTRKNTAAHEAPKAKEAAPAAAAPVADTNRQVALEAEGAVKAKFGAFFDFRFSSFYAAQNTSVVNAHSESGFGLEDGAVTASFEKGRLSAFADIAIRRGKDVDLNSSAATPNQSSNSNLGVGVDKSQVYFKYNIVEGFSIYGGQWDTIYGVELNDSKDRMFGKTGLVYDLTLPVTHTGAMLEYSHSGAYVKAFAANPNNKGSFGTATAGDDNTEYGGAIGYGNEMLHGQIGYMSRPIKGAGSTDLKNRTLLDVVYGMVFGGFAFDLEYSMVTDPNKNTLTTATANDTENAGTGFLALASYKFTDDFLLALRYEHIADDPAGGSVKMADATGVALHYKLSSECELRTEFIDYQYESVAAVKWNDNRWNISTLLMF